MEGPKTPLKVHILTAVLNLISLSCGDLKSTFFVSHSELNDLILIFLLIINLTNGLRLHQFIGTKTTEANKSLKTDANRAH